MNKTKATAANKGSKAFREMMAGIEDGVAFARGDASRGVLHAVAVPVAIDVKAIRGRLGMSQRQFADRFGFDPRALQDWEQGRRRPERSARLFMRVIERAPEAVMAALADPPAGKSGATRERSAKPVSRVQQGR